MRRFAAFGLVALGLAFVAGCGSQSRGSLVVGIRYAGGAWGASSPLTAGRVAIFDGRGHDVGALQVKAGETARAELPPGHYSLGFGDGRPTVGQLMGCQPKTTTVTGSETTDYTLQLGCWPSTPKGVLASIVAAGLAQQSVHLSESHGEDLYGTDHRDFDVDADSGVERVAYPLPGSRAEIRLVNDAVYVQGNPVGLQYTLYVTEAQAKRYAGKWISIPKGDKLYAALAGRLTFVSIIKSVTPQPPYYSEGTGELKLSRRTSHGLKLLDLRADGRYGVYIRHMTARATGVPLPVDFSYSCGMVCDYGGTFSKWNEPVHVETPASSIPIATVRG